MRNDGMKVLYRGSSVSSLRMGLLPKHQLSEPHSSDDPQLDPFNYMAASPYYKSYFRGTTVKMSVQNARTACGLTEQNVGDVKNHESVDKSSFSVYSVFESVNLSYNMDTSLLREMLTLRGH